MDDMDGWWERESGNSVLSVGLDDNDMCVCVAVQEMILPLFYLIQEMHKLLYFILAIERF